jgi:RNA-binding protein YlmH
MESNTDAPAELLALASIEGNFMFDPATHRDFLGAVLNTGVDRRKLGDIIMQGESGAQMLLVPELLEFFQGALTTVCT